jgi:radical SAM protein with 4Fe4S-binding SPASM domain
MKVVGEKFDYSEQTLTKSPSYLLIESTNRCNLRCPTCSRDALTRIGSMSIENFKNIISQLPDLKHVKLHGLGETFLAPDIMKMLTFLKSKQDIETVIITNGNWKNIDHGQVLDATKFIYFSVDGYDQRTYEKSRPGASWKLLTENIQQMTALKHKYNSNILINFVCHTHNTHYLPMMVKLCHQLNVDALRINLMQSWVEEDKFPTQHKRHKDLLFSEVHQFAKYYKEALKLGDEYNFDVEAIGNESFSYNQCIWPFERAYITWDGELVPCCMRPDPIYSSGNVLKKSFQETWLSNRMAKIRTNLHSNKPAAFCRQCPYKMNAGLLKKIKAEILTDKDFGYKVPVNPEKMEPRLLRQITTVHGYK